MRSMSWLNRLVIVPVSVLWKKSKVALSNKCQIHYQHGADATRTCLRVASRRSE